MLTLGSQVLDICDIDTRDLDTYDTNPRISTPGISLPMISTPGSQPSGSQCPRYQPPGSQPPGSRHQACLLISRLPEYLIEHHTRPSTSFRGYSQSRRQTRLVPVSFCFAAHRLKSFWRLLHLRFHTLHLHTHSLSLFPRFLSSISSTHILTFPCFLEAIYAGFQERFSSH